jgi:hypothetical protein
MLMVLIVLGTSIWVYFDAKKLGATATGKWYSKKFEQWGPADWMIGCLLLWIICFPIYLIKRPGLKKRFQPPAVQSPPLQPAAVSSANSQDIDQQLRKLAKLKDDGIISQQDFEQKKRGLLGL